MTNDIHIPVLIDDVMSVLSPKKGDSYLDLTAGYGGHATSIMQKLGKNDEVVVVDRDINSINYLKKNLAVDNKIEFLHSDFYQASKDLFEAKKAFDCILADIGVSSPHLDNPDRGFSFMNEGPLDMRMDNRSSLTASDIVNKYDADSLANVLFKYGELRNSRSLSRKIIEHRPYHSTTELASVIPGNHKTKMRTLSQVFQALRIEVNDELGQLSRSLELWCKLLRPGGRLAVITFHSLEDRIVKQYFSEHGGNFLNSEFTIINKKPLVAKANEIAHNPRARSAKLRALQRK